MRQLKILASLILFFGFINNAFAVYDGLYVGLQAGQVHTTFQPRRFTITSPVLPAPAPPPVSITSPLISPSNTVYAGRIFAGYQFSKFMAIEAGYTYIQPVIYDTSISLPFSRGPGLPDGVVELCDRPRIRVSVFDVLGKLSYSFNLNNSGCGTGICNTSCEPDFFSYFQNAGLGAYIKAGPALVHTSFSGSLKASGAFCSTDPTKNRVVAEVAVGLEAFLTKKFSVDLSYTRYFAGNDYPGATFIALGFTYRFIDTCCGQFLCD